MGEGALDRLLDAEKEAKSFVEKAKDKAKIMIDKAEEEAARSKEKGMNDYLSKRTQMIESSKLVAQNEAEKIRSDGIELAKGLAGKSKSRIPIAVEKVMEMLLEVE